MDTNNPTFALSNNNRYVYAVTPIANIYPLSHKTALKIAELSFNDWCKYLTTYNKRKVQIVTDIVRDTVKDMVLNTITPCYDHIITIHKPELSIGRLKFPKLTPINMSKPHPCYICFTPLSQDEIKQNKNICSDCRADIEQNNILDS